MRDQQQQQQQHQFKGSSLWNGKKKPPPPLEVEKSKIRQTGELMSCSSGGGGKVVLAAIVHHDNCCSSWLFGQQQRQQQEQDRIDHEMIETKKREKVKQEKEKEKHLQKDELRHRNTHDNSNGNNEKARKLANKLASRLMFTKKKQTKTTTTKLIDSAQCNEYLQQEQEQEVQVEEEKEEEEEVIRGRRKSVVDETSKQKPPSKSVKDSSLTPTTTCSPATDSNKVIEFKFDLIVDQENEEDDDSERDSFHLGGQKKLMNNVHAIVESFVLDSNDVCLMSMGRQRNDLNNGYHSNYLFQLASECVWQTFGLLEINNNQRVDLKSCLLELNATLFLSAGEPSETNEKEGNFVTPTQIPFEFVDLLLAKNNGKLNRDNHSNESCAEDEYSSSDAASVWQTRASNQTSIDCSNIHEAKLILERIKANVTSELMHHHYQKQSVNLTNNRAKVEISTRIRRSSLLMICLKLKRRINGGLFSNRMCLIDFDPKFAKLKPILESTFTGHALAHLKRRKLHLQTLESSLANSMNLLRSSSINNNKNPIQQKSKSVSIDSPNSQILLSSSGISVTEGSQFENSNDDELSSSSSSTSSSAATAATAAIAVATAEAASSSASSSSISLMRLIAAKQHHQVASESKLIQAEWLLYKQLSSALIRTLIIVHVHKLSPTSKQLSSSSSSLSSKQQQQHQKTISDYEQKLMADNLGLLEFARSIQRASAMKLKRRRRHLRHHLISSNASLASNISETATTATNATNQDLLLLGSPIRRPIASATLSSSRHHYQQRNIRKHSMDTSFVYGRHLNHLNNNNNHHHHHRQRSTVNPSNFNIRDVCEYKGMDRLLRQTTGDLTESSSMSTSSGSAGYQTKSPISHRAINATTTTATTNLSDSDSVASATFNSHSSSSQHLRSTNRSSHLAGGNKRSCHQRDIELKWMTKQRHQQQLKSELSSTALFKSTSSIRSSTQIIPIDCEPQTDNSSLRDFEHPIISQIRQDDSRTEETQSTLCLDENETIADDTSDICSIVAEPPRELKLEKFLSQLTNSESPDVQNCQQQARIENNNTPGTIDVNRGFNGNDRQQVRNSGSNLLLCPKVVGNNNQTTDDEDDDCKSHSSIVDHLSSLANELNCKLNYRLGQQQPQQQQQQRQQDSLPDDDSNQLTSADNFGCHLDLFAVTGQQQQQRQQDETNHQLTRMGYLQQLLNNSTQLKKNASHLANSRVHLKDTTEQRQPSESCSLLEEQLSELTINCHTNRSSILPTSDNSPSVSSSGNFTNSSNLSSSSPTVSPKDERTNNKTTNSKLVVNGQTCVQQKDSFVVCGIMSANQRQQQQQHNVKTSQC